MNALTKSILAILAIATVAPAQAHFLWAYPDKSGNQCHLQFCESPGDSILPMMASLAPKITFVSSNCQTIRNTDNRLVVTHTPGRPDGATLLYGVLDREGDFLLYYYAKAARNWAEAGQHAFDPGTPEKATFEIVAVREDSKVKLTALFNGKPVQAQFVYNPAPGEEAELQNNPDGTVWVEPKANAPLAVRARHIEPIAGELEGKKYNETRHYATLVVGAPLVQEPEAYGLLESASAKRYNIPADIKTIRGNIEYATDKGTHQAVWGYDLEGGVFIEEFSGDQADQRQLEGVLSSIFQHRTSYDFSKGDGRHPLAFSGNDDLIGTQIALNDPLNSTYRIKNGHVVQVDRVMGGARFVINVLEHTSALDGRVLPRHYTVVRYKPSSTEIETVSNVFETYQEVNGVYLPHVRESIVVRGDQITKTRLVFSDLTIEK